MSKKPCPFCGEATCLTITLVGNYEYAIVCARCTACGPRVYAHPETTTPEDGVAKIITKWNERGGKP